MARKVDPVGARARHIPIPGTYNLRDVGGYPTRDGRGTKRGVLFRSDGLHEIDSSGLGVLHGLGIRAVVDLRSGEEVNRFPDPCASDSRFAYHHVPIVIGGRGLGSLAEIYGSILDNDREAIREVVEVASGDHPVLVHCSIGKDRTGVMIALMLAAVGVPREAIIEDYVMTGPLIEPMVARMRERARAEGREPTGGPGLLGCTPEDIAPVLDRVLEADGSVASFMDSARVPALTLARLRERLVGPGPH